MMHDSTKFKKKTFKTEHEPYLLKKMVLKEKTSKQEHKLTCYNNFLHWYLFEDFCGQAGVNPVHHHFLNMLD